MQAVVVYESMFGNTKEVALAIADGLSSTLDVRSLEVSTAPGVLGHSDLLVVGGPTHAFSMSRSTTRESAKGETEEPILSTTGIREWLADLDIPKAQPYATFDTKVPKPHLPGSAAASAAKRLKKLHGFRVAKPETFWVEGTIGPLAEGELERAREWGSSIAAAVAQTGFDQRKRA